VESTTGLEERLQMMQELLRIYPNVARGNVEKRASPKQRPSVAQCVLLGGLARPERREAAPLT
jgi:hypothetical protein